MELKKFLDYFLYENISLLLISSLSFATYAKEKNLLDKKNTYIINLSPQNVQKAPVPIDLFQSPYNEHSIRRLQDKISNHQELSIITKKLKITQSGLYTFIIKSPAKTQLKINGNLVVRKKKRKKTESILKKGLIFLTSGTHLIHLEITPENNNQEFFLFYESKNLSQEKPSLN